MEDNDNENGIALLVDLSDDNILGNRNGSTANVDEDTTDSSTTTSIKKSNTPVPDTDGYNSCENNENIINDEDVSIQINNTTTTGTTGIDNKSPRISPSHQITITTSTTTTAPINKAARQIPPPLPLSIPPKELPSATLNNKVEKSSSVNINGSGHTAPNSNITSTSTSASIVNGINKPNKSKLSISLSSEDSKENSTESNNSSAGAGTSSGQLHQQNQKHRVKSSSSSSNAKGSSSMNGTLTEEEEQSTSEFLAIVNSARLSKGMSPISFSAALKFLMARKFNVRRALELYDQHFMVRLGQGLTKFDPTEEPLRSELLSGKFTVLPTRDLGSAAIAIFSAKLHQPSTSHHQTLQGLIYQLDCALENPLTQRSGLIFLYDMTGSKYSNFDYELSVKILTLLKGSYPSRLKKVLIVTAPLWFRAPFKILRLFVREKLRDRVFTVSLPQLNSHIPPASLPQNLGGTLVHDHLEWLAYCNKTLGSIDLWGTYPSDKDIVSNLSKSDSDTLDKEIEANMSNGIKGILGKKLRKNGQSTPSPSGPDSSSGSSGFSEDDSLPFDDRTGLTISEFVEHLKQKGRRGLLDEYAEIISKSPEGSFECSKQRGNLNKNRYSDVLCFDHSRVILSTIGTDPSSDYINANFVDGYKQKNAFISTQGPLPKTYGDFWRMIWEQNSVVIVMTTRVIERSRTKCGQYWPNDPNTNITHEGFKLENLSVDTQTDYAVTKLKLTNISNGESRTVTHLQFLSWPDYGCPSSAEAMLKFLVRMRQEQETSVSELAKWDGHALGPPIVVHCSAGIGRTGTLCTMDICIRRLLDQGTIDVLGTVERIRGQRAYSIQVPEQYLFCHAAMIDFSREKGLLLEPQAQDLPNLLEAVADEEWLLSVSKYPVIQEPMEPSVQQNSQVVKDESTGQPQPRVQPSGQAPSQSQVGQGQVDDKKDKSSFKK